MAATGQRTVSVDELLSTIRSKKGERNGVIKNPPSVKTMKPVSKNIPFGTIILLFLVAALGTMVITLRAEISATKGEVADLKNLKEMVAANDPRLKIASLEDKLEWANRENEALKNEISELKYVIEEMKRPKQEKKKGSR
ncbi:MAG: hypothetical protein N2745_00085 [Syntrophorhabdaceae bacterium]|nr:hypothetical protein [Syntrophorhabdaceae bacterium]